MILFIFGRLAGLLKVGHLQQSVRRGSQPKPGDHRTPRSTSLLSTLPLRGLRGGGCHVYLTNYKTNPQCMSLSCRNFSCINLFVGVGVGVPDLEGSLFKNSFSTYKIKNFCRVENRSNRHSLQISQIQTWKSK